MLRQDQAVRMPEMYSSTSSSNQGYGKANTDSGTGDQSLLSEEPLAAGNDTNAGRQSLRRRYGVRSGRQAPTEQRSLEPAHPQQEGSEQSGTGSRHQREQPDARRYQSRQLGRQPQIAAAASAAPQAPASMSSRLRTRLDTTAPSESLPGNLDDGDVNSSELVGEDSQSGASTGARATERGSQPKPGIGSPASRRKYDIDAAAGTSSQGLPNNWYVDWGWDSPTSMRPESEQQPARNGQASASTSAPGAAEANTSSAASSKGRRNQQGAPADADSTNEAIAPRQRWWQGLGGRRADASAFADGSTPRQRAEQNMNVDDQEGDLQEPPGDWGVLSRPAVRPDITQLESAELDLLMPLAPSVSQLQMVSGGTINLLQRLAGSVLGTLVFYKFVLLASASLTLPLWSPVLIAAARNWDVKKSCRFVGLWRTAVVDVSVKGRRRSVKLLLGDDSGLRSSISLPYNAGCDQIQIGDAAEMLVTSSRKDFSTFKALKEVYLPQTGIWLSEYPLTSRQAFLEISLAVEDERQQDAMPM